MTDSTVGALTPLERAILGEFVVSAATAADLRKLAEEAGTIYRPEFASGGLRVLEERLGSVALILDQFEEVLGDPDLRDDAVKFIEQAVIECPDNVHQLISLREDSKHLLKPLETGRLKLGDRRLYPLEPLGRPSLEQAVTEVVGEHSLPPLSPSAMERVFSSGSQGATRGVSALEINATLRFLYSEILKSGEMPERVEDGHLDALLSTGESLLERWLVSSLRGDLSPVDETLPFPGPAPYQAMSERDFKGRDREIGELARRLKEWWINVLMAPSGAGKTSLVHAGLVPAMRRARLWDLSDGLSVLDSRLPIAVSRWNKRATGRAHFGALLFDGVADSLEESAEWYRAVMLESLDSRGETAARVAIGLEGDEAEHFARLLEVAPCRQRIALVPPPDAPARAEVADMICTMAARMAPRLVSHSNFKRPVEMIELRQVAYLADVQTQSAGADDTELPVDFEWGSALLFDAGALHGRFMHLMDWSEGRPTAQAEADRRAFMDILEYVFDTMVDALTSGFVLKQSGEVLELVHDGFCSPFRHWGDSWLQSPRAWLGSLYGLVGETLSFPMASVASTLDGVTTIGGVVWRSCMIENADFSGISFVDCDFSGSQFRGCVFGVAEPDRTLMENCDFQGASFDSCVFGREAETGTARQVLSRVSLRGTEWKECLFRNVDLGSDSTFEHADFAQGTMFGCAFTGTPAQNLQLHPQVFDEIEFTGGAVVTGGALYADPGQKLVVSGRFADTEMKAFRLQRLAIDSRHLTFSNCNLTGSYMNETVFAAQGNAVFRDCITAGSVMLECTLAGHVMDAAEGGADAAAVLLLNSCLDGVRIRRVDCSGARIERCELIGTTSFDESVLLRCSFDGLTGTGELDLESAGSVLYCRIPEDQPVKMTGPQRAENPFKG